MPVSASRAWALQSGDEWDTPDGGTSRVRSKQASAIQNDWVVKAPASFDTSWDRRNARLTRQAGMSPCVSGSFSPATPILQTRSDDFSAPLTPQWSFQKASTPSTAFSTVVDSSEPFPEHYLDVLGDAFGQGADLYSDVLCVERSATPRTIRIAYFRRGREVLSGKSKHHTARANATISDTVITDVAKLKFQAVSMAYEIISNPLWLDSYEKYRLTVSDETNDDEDDEDDEADVLSAPSSYARSLASTSALRKSSSYGSRRLRKSASGVRWNEEVEELVYNQDPDEMGCRMSKRDKQKKKAAKTKKKKKQRIAVEADDLEKHLAQLDKEAEKNFVHDFLDDLERSVDHFLNFKSDSMSDEAENEDDEERDGISARIFFPELEDEPISPIIKGSRTGGSEEVTGSSSHDPERPLTGLPRQSLRPEFTTASQREIDNAGFFVAADSSSRKSPNRTPTVERTAPNNPFADTRPGSPLETAALTKDSRQEVVVTNRLPNGRSGTTSHREQHAFDGDFQDDPIYTPRKDRYSSSRELAARGDPSVPCQSRHEAGATFQCVPSRRRLPTTEISLGESHTDLCKFALLDGEEAQQDNYAAPPMQNNDAAVPLQQLNPAGVISQQRPQFEAPQHIEVTMTFQRITMDDGESAALTVDDTVSTLSASVVQRHINKDLTNSRHDIRKPPQMERVQEEDSKMIITGDTTVAGSANTAREKSSTTNADTVQMSPVDNADAGTVDVFFENMCGDNDPSRSMSSRGLSTTIGGCNDYASTDLTSYVRAYMNALSEDLTLMGHSIRNWDWDVSQWMEALTISESDLDGLLKCISETDMDIVSAASAVDGVASDKTNNKGTLNRECIS